MSLLDKNLNCKPQDFNHFYLNQKKGLAPRSLQSIKLQNKADMKVIKVWRNMSVLELADAMDKDLGKAWQSDIFLMKFDH